MDAAVLLQLDDVRNRLVLDSEQVGLNRFAGSNIVSLLDQLLRTKQRADVLGAEGRISLSRSHLEQVLSAVMQG